MPQNLLNLIATAQADARDTCSAIFAAQEPDADAASQFRAAQRTAAALSDVMLALAGGLPADLSAVGLLTAQRDRYRHLRSQAPGWAAPEYDAAARVLDRLLQQITSHPRQSLQ